jgi:hypothetical protein
MSAEFRSVTGRAHQFVPIAQITERTRPKRQVAGEIPAGDANSVPVVSSRQHARLSCGRSPERSRSGTPFYGAWFAGNRRPT